MAVTYGAGTYGGVGSTSSTESVTILGRDKVIIEDIDVNDLISWFILEEPGFQFTPAKKKLNFVGSSLSDGSVPSGDESRYDNAEMSFAVARAVAGSVDDGFVGMSELTKKINKARDTQGGLPVIWTPVQSSTPLTWYMLEGEYEEFRTGLLDGYPNAPAILCHLYLRPFGYASERSMPLGITEPFLFDSLTNGAWRYDTGAGGLAVVFGVLAVASAGTRRIYRSSTFSDSTITTRFKWGTTLTGSSFSIVLKRKDANNRIIATVAASGALSITKTVTGAGTILAATTTFSEAPVAGRYYWLQSSMIGDSIVMALYADNQNPLTKVAPIPIATLAYTLTSSGAEATLFGVDVRAQPGIQIVTAASDTTMAVSDWQLRDTPDITNSDPLVSFEIPNVPGHVPAEARLDVKEGSSQARSHMEWGLECKNYDPAVVWPLLIDSDKLDTSGFAGQPSGGGQYDPDASGNSAITANQLSETIPLAVCGTGNQQHIGPFKVKAHVKGNVGVQCRLAWRQGGGPLRRNDYAPALSGQDWLEIDLGTINVSDAPVGTQRWEGRIEAFGVTGGQLILDYILLIPLERYGVARAPLSPLTPTTYTALDHFNQVTTALDASSLLVAPTDGKWHVSNANPITVDNANHWASRAVMADADLISGSYARVGTTNFSAIQAQVDTWISNRLLDTRSYHDEIRWGLLLSYQNVSNWVMVIRQLRSVQTPSSGGGSNPGYDHTTVLRMYKRVGGATPVQMAYKYEQISPNQKQTLIASMDQTGVWQIFSFPVGTKQPAVPSLSGQDADLAGSLQNGLFGIYDACTSPNVFANVSLRFFDNFIAFAATPDSVVGANRTLEIRPETAIREVLSGLGTFYGDVPMYRSARGLYVPIAGDDDRISRVAAKLRRTDVDGGLPDGNPATDAATYSVSVTPRYLHPPGAE